MWQNGAVFTPISWAAIESDAAAGGSVEDNEHSSRCASRPPREYASTAGVSVEVVAWLSRCCVFCYRRMQIT